MRFLIPFLLFTVSVFGQDKCPDFVHTNTPKPKVKWDSKWVGQIDAGMGIPVESGLSGYSVWASSLSASVKPVASSNVLFTQDWIIQMRGLEGDWQFDEPTPTVSFVFMGLAREFKMAPFNWYASTGLAIGTSEQRTTQFPAIASIRFKRHIAYNTYVKLNTYIMLDDAQLNSTTQFIGVSLGGYLK